MHRIEMPIDGAAKIESFIPEQVKTVQTNLIGLLDDPLSLRWREFAQEFHDCCDGVGGEEEVAGSGRAAAQITGKVVAEAGEQGVLTAGELLAQAVAQFRPIHLREAPRNFAQSLKIHSSGQCSKPVSRTMQGGAGGAQSGRQTACIRQTLS